jgi:hypothetical protein
MVNKAMTATTLRAPWLWLALTYLVLGIGTSIVYGGADYPGLLFDSGGTQDGADRVLDIAAWRERYFHIGLPFTAAAAATTLGWLLTLRKAWPAVVLVGAGALAAHAAISGSVWTVTAWLGYALLVPPVLMLAVVPWQLVVAVLVGVAVWVLVSKPSRERFVVHHVAFFVGGLWQTLFVLFCLGMSTTSLG